MKVERLQRVLRLVTVLQSQRYYSPDDLARQLGVSRRTIFRYLNMLYEAGIPYYHDEEKGGYCINNNVFLPPLNLKLTEALALLLVAQYAGGHDGVPLQKDAQEAAIKIESVLPRHIQQHCGALLKTMSIRLAASSRHEGLDKTLNQLQQAVRRRQKVKLRYISFNERRQITTTLSPYQLHFAQRAWYVIGHSSLHRQVRIFKLGRIKDLEPLKGTYTPSKSFRLEDYLGQAWSIIPEGKVYHIKLLFSPLVAANVAEVIWHRSQKLIWHDDGTLTFEVDVDGLREISWWIMGYGDQVEVLEPAELRRRIGQMAKKMAGMY